ncbi:MAG: site-2 protease family protein, partial [Patescibacteria group bacterium]
FAWLILSAGYGAGLPASSGHTGMGTVENAKGVVVGLLPESPAIRSGVLAEDVIARVSTPTAGTQAGANAEVLRAFIKEHQEESLIVSVMRLSAQTGGEEEKTFVMRPTEGFVEGRKALGVELDDIGILKLPLHLALVEGATLTYHMTVSTAGGLLAFFSQIGRGVADFSSVAGPIGIAGIGAKAVDHGFTAAIMLTALISINLAIINLLPIPGLDGGRLLIIAIESVIRRPVPERLSVFVSILGFMFLIGIMLLVSYHDIARLVG